MLNCYLIKIRRDSNTFQRSSKFNKYKYTIDVHQSTKKKKKDRKKENEIHIENWQCSTSGIKLDWFFRQIGEPCDSSKPFTFNTELLSSEVFIAIFDIFRSRRLILAEEATLSRREG